jgi:hypothetical protein
VAEKKVGPARLTSDDDGSNRTARGSRSPASANCWNGRGPRGTTPPRGLERRESPADTADRGTVSGHAVLPQSADGGRPRRQSQSGAAADAAHGDRGDLPQAADDLARGRTQDLTVFAAERRDPASQPRVGDGHHLRAAAAWVSVPRGGHRLVQPTRLGVATVEHARRQLMLKGARRSSRAGAAGGLQFICATTSTAERLVRVEAEVGRQTSLATPTTAGVDCAVAQW